MKHTYISATVTDGFLKDKAGRNYILLGKLITIFLAGACGNRTHLARFWQATLDLKSRRDTRTLCTPMFYFTGFFCIKTIAFFSSLSISSGKYICVLLSVGINHLFLMYIIYILRVCQNMS